MEKNYQKPLAIFGKRIKQLRTEKGLTQLDLEFTTGVTEADISRIENGKKNIEFITIIKLADGLDVTLQELFTFPDSK